MKGLPPLHQDHRLGGGPADLDLFGGVLVQTVIVFRHLGLGGLKVGAHRAAQK